MLGIAGDEIDPVGSFGKLLENLFEANWRANLKNWSGPRFQVLADDRPRSRIHDDPRTDRLNNPIIPSWASNQND